MTSSITQVVRQLAVGTSHAAPTPETSKLKQIPPRSFTSVATAFSKDLSHIVHRAQS